MAMFDVVKYEVDDKEFCYKFPSDDLRVGTQLVVYPAQTAFFVKGGKIFDEFTAGTYTIKSENLPLLRKLINIPFGNQSPFKAEVWFINQIAKLDIKWGTPQPIYIEDPRYKIIIPIRAFGQYGFRIVNPRLFLEMLIGNMTSFTAEKIEQYFRGKVISQLSSLVSEKITADNISVLDINAHLVDMSTYCNNALDATFSKYGIEIIEFSVMSVNMPSDDPSLIKLREAKDMAARLAITGKDVYQMERSFDVLQQAAANEGVGGQFMSMGTGLGVGMGVGTTIGNMASQMINTNPSTPPPMPAEQTYFVYINGQQHGGQTASSIANLISQGIVTVDTLVWRAGMPAWVKIGQLPELSHLFNNQTPPPIL